MTGSARTIRIVISVAAVVAVLLPTTAASAATRASARWTIYEPTNTGIPGDYVMSIAFDGRGVRWLTANDPIWDEGGLARFDGKTWRDFTNVDGKSPAFNTGVVHVDAAGTPWVASDRGLLRFTGKRLVVAWSMANAPWPTNLVTDFAWDSQGTLWVSLSDVTTVKGGLARYDGSTWTVFTTANGLPWTAPWDNVESVEIDANDDVYIGSNVLGGAKFDGTAWTWMKEGWVNDIVIASDGQPWYSFATGGVKAWDGTTWVDHTPPVFTSGFTDLALDRAGDVWVGTFISQIWRFHAGAWDLSYTVPNLTHVYALAFDARNRPWTGGIGGMSFRQPNGAWTVYTTQNTALPSRWINDITVDSTGLVWFGTSGGGVSRFDGVRWTDYNPNNWGTQPWPFPTDSAFGSVEDAAGDLWTTPTFTGIGRWDGSAWTQFRPFDDYQSMARDPSGTLWVSGASGVRRWDGASWVSADPPASGEIGDIAADAAGNIWVATITGLEKFDGTTWTVYTKANSGLPDNFVTAVATEPTGAAIWVGTANGLARFDGTTWTVYTEANSGLAANVVTAIVAGPGGVTWIGAFDGNNWPYHGGLARFDGTAWTTYTTENSPLPHEQIEAVALDASGNVWVGTASEGVAKVTYTP